MNIKLRKTIALWMVGSLLIIFQLLALHSEWVSSSQLHTNLELVGTLLAIGVGVMALVRYYSAPEVKYLLVGAGFLGTGFLDGYHAVVTSVYFAPYMPSGLPSLVPWSWIASRLFLSVMLFVTWYVWYVEVRKNAPLNITPYGVYTATLAATLTCFFFFMLSPLPVAYYENAPLHIHRPEELIPGLIFLFAFIGFLKKGKWHDDTFEFWLLLCLLINLIGEVAVMAFSQELYDADFDFAHFLKDASYIFALTGLLVSMYTAFVKLQQLIDAEKEHSLELQKREEALLNANQDLESFSYSVSHDLRTPLRAIDGFSLILLEDYNEKLDDEGKRLLNIIRKSTERMSRLINDILQFSRAGRTEIHRQMIDVNELVEEVVRDHLDSINDEKASVEVLTLSPVVADPTLLRQIFENLISNALKFSRGRDVPKIRISSKEQDNNIVYTVSDNGAGFDMKYADKLFGVFQRLHGVEEFEGNGIGLAIVKKFVTRQGGKIWAESEIDKGATFHFSLPRKGAGQ